MRRDELSLAWPLLLIVEGRSAEARLAEADAWIAARSRRGVVAVRCALGTIAGLFFFEVGTTQGGDYLLADRLILVDLFGSHRTLAAMLRATRELGEIPCLSRDPRPTARRPGVACVEGVAEVARRLGLMRGERAWHLDLEAALHRRASRPAPVPPLARPAMMSTPGSSRRRPATDTPTRNAPAPGRCPQPTTALRPRVRRPATRYRWRQTLPPL